MSRLRFKEAPYELPISLVVVDAINVTDKCLAPPRLLVQGSLCDIYRKYIKVRGSPPLLRRVFLGLTISISAIETNKDNEIAFEILDYEAPVEIRGPPALDLDSGRSVGSWMYRNQIIARRISILLVSWNALDEEMCEYEELGALSLELRASSQVV